MIPELAAFCKDKMHNLDGTENTVRFHTGPHIDEKSVECSMRKPHGDIRICRVSGSMPCLNLNSCPIITTE